ncbi:MAG TPA: tripartite tricarboxylate transporter substrate-binding protein [Burkholderiales bacterium]|nr:tripartite tricarboxylate transporter substrate-binding protein [Burkholderiales bacterium]
MNPARTALRNIGWLPAAMLLSGIACANAAEYPVKPLRIVTSEAGGGNDVPARIVAQGLTLALGQQVVIENRPSGVVPAEIVAKAAPNGYTLLFYNNALWTAPLIQATPYDMLRDFTPVSAVARAVNVLTVNSALPAKSVADLVALAKTKPGGLNYGSSGTGASNHLAAEIFRTMAQIDIVRVNYKGAGPALTALIAGELQLMFPSAGAATPHVRAGRVKALAVTSAAPSALFPGLPAIAATLPGYESLAIYGLFAPAGTPPAIIVRLNTVVAQFLARADIQERFAAAGMDAAASTPGQLSASVQAEVARIGKVIRAAGIRAD